MNPKLLALSGPLKGSVIPLDKTPFPIGRESSTRLRLRSPGVSRQHCVIERDGEDRFWLTDLGSRNGTFVNGVPRTKGELHHGDQIRVGESYLLLSLHDSEPAHPHNIVDFDAEVVTGSLAEISPEASLYLDRQGALPEGLTAQQVLDDMRALVDLSTAVHTTRDVEELQRRLLESLFRSIPADRGVVLLTADGNEEQVSVVGWDRDTGRPAPIPVSRSIVQKVLRDGRAILNNSIEDDAPASLVDADARSVIAVPLMAGGKTLGAIYLYSCDPEARFNDGHLQLLTAMAGIAALALENARQAELLDADRQQLLSEVKIEHNMVGESDALRRVHDFIAKVAPTSATVLISGESGTGKELVARAIHWNSPRAGKRFVAFNCAALVENLLESEMFGHQRGAFTGAIAQKKGKFEIADGGTIFLDEIGELAHLLQAKLLRVLQEREFERVGGTQPIKVDVRVIAACSRELKDLVKEGKFREDLFYRLNVVSVEMPPLRDRQGDIPLLAMYFTSKLAEQCHRRITEISAAALESLQNYSWPGNVRELENAIERAVVLGSGDAIRPEDLPEAVMEAEQSSGGPVPRYHEAILKAKRELILRAFQEAHGDHLKAAQLIDVHPNYLYRLIRNMNLKPDLKK